jgi:hypothetical protein
VRAAEVIEQVAAAFDECAASALADAETVLRNHGCTDEELALEIDHMCTRIADARRGALAHARAFAETGHWGVH